MSCPSKHWKWSSELSWDSTIPQQMFEITQTISNMFRINRIYQDLLWVLRVSKIVQDVTDFIKISPSYCPVFFCETIEIEDCFGPTHLIFNVIISVPHPFHKKDKVVYFQNVEICKILRFGNNLGSPCMFWNTAAINKERKVRYLVEIWKVPQLSKIISETIPKP